MIREFDPSEAHDLWLLYFNTIRTVNIRDYTQEQVEVWAKDDLSPQVWAEKMNAISPFVCIREGVITGYSDLQPDGLIDHFFCHHEYQGQGVGKEMMEKIHALAHEQGIRLLYSNVSITARPFYERFGFVAVKEQHNEKDGEILINYRMEKSL
tara:strand:- start:262 stop:720 length:459 start_codon:yes stop_codon:yes gene_type:complete